MKLSYSKHSQAQHGQYHPFMLGLYCFKGTFASGLLSKTLAVGARRPGARPAYLLPHREAGLRQVGAFHPDNRAVTEPRLRWEPYHKPGRISYPPGVKIIGPNGEFGMK